MDLYALGDLLPQIDPEAFVLAGNVLKPDGPIWPHVLRSFKETALSEVAVDRAPKSVNVLPYVPLGPLLVVRTAAVGVTWVTAAELTTRVAELIADDAGERDSSQS